MPINLEKIKKALDDSTIEALDSADAAELKNRITLAAQAMQKVKDELEANEEYQNLKESLAAVTAGKKEVDKRQKAIIKYALHLLESK